MQSVVMFFGAGASKPFGYLLTAQILPHIVRLASEGRLLASGGDGARRGFLERLRTLFPGASADDKGAVGLPQITDVLSLLDRLATDGNGLGPRFSADDARQTRHQLDRAIAEVLDGPADPPAIADSLKKRRQWADAVMRRIENGDRVTLITTNYDLLFERALYERMAEGCPFPALRKLAATIDCGFPWRMPLYGDQEPVAMRPERPRLAVFKLHGSLNWLRCNVCGYIYINPRGAIYHQAYANEPPPPMCIIHAHAAPGRCTPSW
ncbi:SIR2 family protein [Pendulispora albinea]|uniref:SIR2 family protein n=1 Tax=Pendulispora albinea TaxID=2741071 RepID=A0ABZ2M422_9BACT